MPTTKKRPRNISPAKKRKPANRKQPPATAEQPVEATDSEPVADPTPTQQVEHEHYEEIRRLNQKVCEARSAWTVAKDRAASFKKNFDALNNELLQTIWRGPDPQLKLPLEGQPWRSVDVAALAIGDSIINELIDGHLTTLGDLSDFWKAGKVLTDVEGIGSVKADKVADAFAAYGVEHPELFGEPEAEGLIEDNDSAADGEVEADDDEDDDNQATC